LEVEEETWSREAEPSRYQGQFRPKFSRIHQDPDLWWVTPMGIRYMVGVVGLRATGKSTVVAYLAEKKGFDVYSMSRIVRDEAEARGLSLKRTTLQNLGDELRLEGLSTVPEDGPPGSYLARLQLRQIHQRHHFHNRRKGPKARVAVVGFKHPDELALFRQMTRFTTLLVSCSNEARARRALETGLLLRELQEANVAMPEANALCRGRVRSQMEQLFFEHLDGRDRDGHSYAPWAGDLGQAVGRIVQDAEAHLVDEPTGAGGEAVRIINQAPFDDLHEVELFRHIDTLVDQLDHAYPVD